MFTHLIGGGNRRRADRRTGRRAQLAPLAIGHGRRAVRVNHGVGVCRYTHCVHTAICRSPAYRTARTNHEAGIGGWPLRRIRAGGRASGQCRVRARSNGPQEADRPPPRRTRPHQRHMRLHPVSERKKKKNLHKHIQISNTRHCLPMYIDTTYI